MSDHDWPDPKTPTAEHRAEADDAAGLMRQAANRLDRMALAINDAAAECGMDGVDLRDAWMELANVRPGLHRAVADVLGPVVILRLAKLLNNLAEEAGEVGPNHVAVQLAAAIMVGSDV